jgi:hypothetical protein
MHVVLLAQAGGLSTTLRIIILEKHELVDCDWEEEQASKQSTGMQGAKRKHRWTMWPARAQDGQERGLALHFRRQKHDFLPFWLAHRQ